MYNKFNPDYFPTPMSLIEKMINKLDRSWKHEIKHVLEPSAGSGGLIEGMQKLYMQGQEINGFWCKGRDKCDIKFDAIEIEEGLVDILRGKGINVAYHGDFMEYQPQKYYDLIFCNLPFSCCTKHLIKCIEMQERIGGKIVAITSASILENTYSNDREYLKKLLDTYNADIEYLEEAFMTDDTERKTNVKVALIYINIPMKNKESMFEKEFKRDFPQINFKEINSVTIKRNKLEQLVFEYDLVINSVTKLFEEEMRINSLLKGFNLDSGIKICNGLTHPEKMNINDFIEETNQKFWNRFINETEFETILPSQLKDNFRSNMQRQRNIAFNLDNLHHFYKELMLAIPDSYEKAVAKVFDDVTRRWNYTDSEWCKTTWGYDGWKSNNAFAIKNRVIIPCYLANPDSFASQIPNELIDLNIIFNNIAGVKNKDDLKYGGEVHNAIKNNCKKFETEHFLISTFKKGTMWVYFKNKKHLAMFNYMAGLGKSWLNEGFADKPYDNMTDYEKEIVKALGFDIKEFKEMQISNGKRDYLRLMA